MTTKLSILRPAVLALGALCLCFIVSLSIAGAAMAQTEAEARTRYGADDEPRSRSRINPEETPQFCHDQYEKCVLACDKDPLNKTRYDREACYSSCWSTYSGCGR